MRLSSHGLSPERRERQTGVSISLLLINPSQSERRGAQSKGAHSLEESLDREPMPRRIGFKLRNLQFRHTQLPAYMDFLKLGNSILD